MVCNKITLFFVINISSISCYSHWQCRNTFNTMKIYSAWFCTHIQMYPRTSIVVKIHVFRSRYIYIFWNFMKTMLQLKIDLWIPSLSKHTGSKNVNTINDFTNEGFNLILIWSWIIQKWKELPKRLMERPI